MAKLAFVTCALVLALAVFIRWPAPELSEDLLEWKESGNTFSHNGYHIFYHDVKGSGSPDDVLVLLHGYPTSTYDFIEVWDILLEKHGRVIAPDFLGFGLSDKPVGYKYSVMDMADMIGSLLVTLKVEYIHILAHDLGDTVAQEIIARYNEGTFEQTVTIESVCLLNGGILPEHHQQRLVQKLLLNPYAAPVVMRLMNFFTFRLALGECIGDETRLSDEEYQDHWTLLRHNDGHLVQHGLIKYIPERIANRDRWVTALSDTKVPLHLIYGAADPINPPATFLADYKKLFPNSGVTELPVHIGHYPHLEDPDGVLMGYGRFHDSLDDGADEEEEEEEGIEVEGEEPEEDVEGDGEEVEGYEEKEREDVKEETTDQEGDEDEKLETKDVEGDGKEDIQEYEENGGEGAEEEEILHQEEHEDEKVADEEEEVVELEQDRGDEGREELESAKEDTSGKSEPLKNKREHILTGEGHEEIKPNDDVLIIESEVKEVAEEHQAAEQTDGRNGSESQEPGKP